MKTLFFFSAAVIIVLAKSYAQVPYPHLTIRQIQEVSVDSLNNATSTSEPRLTISSIEGDTVWTSGIVVMPPRDPVTQNGVLFTGDRWRLVIVDPNETEWNAITIVSEDTTLSKQTNGIDLALTGDSISVLGVVTEFATLTQINMLHVDSAFVFHGVSDLPPEPTHLVADFMNGTPPSLATTIYNPGEKFESQLMWIRNVTIIDKPSNEVFRVADAEGNVLACDDESNEIFANKDQLPPIGAVIDSMRGIMGFNSGVQHWEFFPMYLAEIFVAGALPPEISGLDRSLTNVGPTDSIKVSAEITDADGAVSSAELRYQVNDLASQSLPMALEGGSTWSATIPPVGLDSAFVNYYILATDDSSNTSTSPADTTKDRLFFFVLNRSLTIRELQFTPYSRRNSAYENLRVSVDGIITSDRSDLGSIFLQDGSSAWSGIHLFFRTSDDTLLQRGDQVTVTGRVVESFFKTQIDSAQFVLNSSGNPLPEPVVVMTDSVKTGGPLAEQFESMLVKLENVYVVSLNADAARNSNFGEWRISEDSAAITGLRVDDLGVASGNVSFDNDITSAPNGTIQLKLMDFFGSITGVLDFTFSDFKLQPRSDADFVGFVATSVERDESVVPEVFVVHQNYPNPFNPATKIRYEIPRTSHVNVKIYSILGQEIATLVDEAQTAGAYIVTFDAQKLATGVYFYRVAAGDFVAVKKMLLLK